MNNFLDVTNGGPQAFLLQNLLRFPQAMSPNAVFGSAVHAVLQRAHVHQTSSGEKRPVEDILHDFELQLQNSRLDEYEFNRLLEKGSDVLPTYLNERYASFIPEQIAEYSFRNQGIVLDGVRLTGAIDLMLPHEQSHAIVVTDYKTGKPSRSWQGNTDYEKIKLHKYRQQLMMYKLLVEGSRDFGGKYHVSQGIIEFIEADDDGVIHQLIMDIDREEFEKFKQLVRVVWEHIMKLDMPDTSHYPTNYKGLTMFEDDLLGSA
jgi:DNA helicase-2/ATP-dependent DNA helicase PcrA